jgi:Zn-finger protein
MSDLFDINSEIDKKINDELNKLQTIEEKIMEKMPNIKNVKFQKASDYVPKCLQITREDNVKYNVIYNIDYPDTGEYETLRSKIQIKSITTRLIFHHNEVLNKIIKIENTIKEIINTIRKLNFKSKIKFMGDSINREQFSKEDLSTHYSGNQYIFSFKVKNRIITKEYSQDNFDSLTIISE